MPVIVIHIANNTQRRRTQIRMAQRAYRSRKESTISTLEKEVKALRGANEQMSSMLRQLLESATGEGLLQREPQFGQQLQTTTEKLLAMVQSTGTPDTLNDNQNDEEDDRKTRSPEPARTTKPRRTKGLTNVSPIEPL